MNLVALPAFTDPSIRTPHHRCEALAVDPRDATPVIDALDRFGRALPGILVTHHRGDHLGNPAAVAAAQRERKNNKR